MDLAQLYGPGFAGYLDGRSRVRERDAQSLQGLGMLSQLQRQSEQMKLMEQDLALKKLSEERQRRQMEYGLGLLQGGSPAQAALTQGAAQGDIGPTETNAARIGMLAQQPGGSAVGGLTPDQILGLGISGIARPKDILDIRAESRPKYEVQNGAIIGGRPGEVPGFAGFVPQVRMSDNGQVAGVMPDGQGGIRSFIPQGALENFAAYEGVRARAPMGNPIEVSRENRAIAEAQDRGIPVQPLQAAPQTGQVQFPSNGMAQPGQLSQEQILMQERAVAVQKGDLNGIAEIDRELANLRRRGGAAPQAQPQAAQPAQSGLNISPEQRRKLELERPQATLALENTTAALSDLKNAAERIRDMPGFAGNFGLSGMVFNRPGGDAANASTELNTLRTQIAFSALQAMRDASKSGGALGAISDRENDMLQNAWASFEKAQSAEQAKKSLQEVARRSQAAMERLKRAYEMSYGAAPTGATGSFAEGGSSAGFRILNVRPAR